MKITFTIEDSASNVGAEELRPLIQAALNNTKALDIRLKQVEMQSRGAIAKAGPKRPPTLTVTDESHKPIGEYDES
jgi:hypothetical protein